MHSKRNAEPFAEKYPRLVVEVEEFLVEGERLMGAIRLSFRGLRDAL